MADPLRVWLVWQGEYSDAEVVGVYSSLAAAREVCAMMPGTDPKWPEYDGLHVRDEHGHVVDGGLEFVRAGLSRWRVQFSHDAIIFGPEQMGLATGEPPHVCGAGYVTHVLMVEMDARDAEHARKIAADARAQYLALKDTHEGSHP